MTCSRCGSDRLFQFEADPLASKRAVNPGTFPLVCRSCGQITVDGKTLSFPEAFENQAKDLAEAAMAAGTAASIRIAEDPTARVVNYFAKTYREAYLDGFLRCLAFYQHNVKEGRLKRLRELWQTTSRHPDHSVARVVFVNEAFEEFDQLMMLGPVPD